MKQVIAVRTDIKMGKGKIAAQVGHACVLASEAARVSHPEWWNEWWKNAYPKIVVKVPGYDDLEDIRQKAERIGLPHGMVRDLGRTQLVPGTVTCIAVGPAPDDLIDGITKGFSLL